MARGDLTDREWSLISPLLPSECGRWVRPSGDNHRFLNGMLYVLRTGCPLRGMHERTENGTRSMSGSGVGLNRVSGMPCCKLWWT
ncbi:transposase [Gluconobacter kanchanaburiensis]|uniref:transposase n=1 Tax=Gluconobacter kanchanaburiensis TaxID=563199 RepID=UPI003530CC70